MDDDYIEMAVFDFRRTAVEAMELLQANGVVEVRVRPATAELLSPYVVAVDKSRTGDAGENSAAERPVERGE